jgi:hypothetical protein
MTNPHGTAPGQRGWTVRPVPIDPPARCPVTGAFEGTFRSAPRNLLTYLSLEQAAEITEQSIQTLRRRISDGTLPAPWSASTHPDHARRPASPRAADPASATPMMRAHVQAAGQCRATAGELDSQNTA